MISYRGMRIATLSDVELEGAKVLLRSDLNSPVDRSGNIIDDSRLREAVPTIRELLERGASVVVMSHQGRPLKSDFISLEPHAKILSSLVGVDVEFVPDVAGPEAIRRIRAAEPGSVVMLDNTRLMSEDYIEASPEAHARSILVSRLAPLFDYYVNDAFSASHRSQATLVGFPMVLPSVAGRLVEREVRALGRALESGDRPKIFVVGGAKLEDAVGLIRSIAESGVADEILTTGLVSLLFHVARGSRVSGPAREAIASRASPDLVSEARELLSLRTPIRLPIDYVVEEGGATYISDASRLRGVPMDIGPSTIEYYTAKIRRARVVVIRGPAGVVEEPRYREGTRALVEASLRSGSYTILGGGHFRIVLSEISEELKARVGHISTAGGALLHFLSGKPLPALESLAESARKFGLLGG